MTFTEPEMQGLVGWDRRGARKMGIQTYWGQNEGIKKRMVQCLLNASNQNEAKRQKTCQYGKCSRCKSGA